MQNKESKILIEGASGGGKSALLANWLQSYRTKRPKHLLFEYYLGASTDSADPSVLVRRLIETIKRITGSNDEIAGDPQKLYDSVPTWLASASSYAGKRKTQWVLVIDSLNSLTDLKDLRWLPEFLPPHITLIISTLPGEVKEALLTKVSNKPNSRQQEKWHTLQVKPLTSAGRKNLLITYLAKYNKTLAPDLLRQAIAHPLSNNPLFLRTLAEELRLFGIHEELQKHLKHYLTSKTIDDLFEKVLKRVEGDNGKEVLQKAMQAIWASRSGLTEKEILAIVKLKPATWAPIRNALDECLLESNGKIAFAHDYMRIAVKDRYLKTKLLQKQAHIDLAKYFQKQIADTRRAEEEPYQWQRVKNWPLLKACLTDRTMFEALRRSVSDQELWGYWILLEKNTSTLIEKAYEVAWSKWKIRGADKLDGELSNNLGRFLIFAGKYGRFTEQLFLLSLRIFKVHYNIKSRRLAEALNDVGTLYLFRSDYQQAEPFCRKALEIAERTWGSKHTETCTALVNLSFALKGKGDLLAAETFIRRAIAIADKKSSRGDAATSFALDCLASLQADMGEYKEAIRVRRRVLEINERLYGLTNTLTGISLNNLASLLHDIGEHSQAEKLYRRAVMIAEDSHGPLHPETGSRLNNLGLLLTDMGDYHNAEPILKRALAISEKTQGVYSPSTGTSLNSLGLLYERMCNYSAAEPMFRRALRISEKALGAENPITAHALNNLAGLLSEKSDYREAIILHQRALAIRENTFGFNHENTYVSMNGLACALYSDGQKDAAETVFRRLITSLEEKLGSDPSDCSFYHSVRANIDITMPMMNLALVLEDSGNLEAAQSFYRRALEIRKNSIGIEHADTARVLYSLGNLLLDQKKLAEAEDLLRQEIAILRKIDSPDSVSLLSSLNNLGIELRDAGELEKADLLLTEAHDMSKRVYSDQPLKLATSLHAIGKLRLMQKRLSEAKEFLEQCLEIRKANLPKDDQRIISIKGLLIEVSKN